MNDSDTGYILEVREYREHDGFVTFLGKKYGLMRLVLPGYFSAKSKQLSLGLEYSYVKYQFNYKANSLNRIIGGELLDAYKENRQHYEWLVYVSAATEILVTLYPEEFQHDVYVQFSNVIQSLVPEKAFLTFLTWFIDCLGFMPEVNECVVCGSKKINQFSSVQGGFLCVDHAHDKDEQHYLQHLRHLINSKVVRSEIEQVEVQHLRNTLIAYLEYHCDLKFKCSTLLNDV